MSISNVKDCLETPWAAGFAVVLFPILTFRIANNMVRVPLVVLHDKSAAITVHEQLNKKGYNMHSVRSNQLPVGAILPFSGVSDPVGHLICDGRAILKSGEYSALYQVIGDTYAGSNPPPPQFFRIPNIQGRTIVGVDNVKHPLGEFGGEETHILSMHEMPAHNHSGRTGTAFASVDPIRIVGAIGTKVAVNHATGYSDTGNFVDGVQQPRVLQSHLAHGGPSTSTPIMKEFILNRIAKIGCVVFCLAFVGLTDLAWGQTTSDPFKVSNYVLPPSYTGPRFVLNHDYPATNPPPVQNPPWASVSNGKPLTRDNAIAYVDALKTFVAPSMRTLLMDYPKWDPIKERWYSMPWLFDAQEPIHGAYVGTASFPVNMFPLSGLKKDMSTWVVTLYDPRGAYMLGQIWGKDAKEPDLSKNKAQYPEGAVTIKIALTTATPSEWSPIEGAIKWQLFAPPAGSKPGTPPIMFDAYVFQLDIIIKDPVAAPDSQWVFSTIVYDNRVKGDAWDQLVPLGAMWGNDPLINSAEDPNALLQQSVINPMAPLYAVETLGYGGRLSGPNDGAVVQDVLIDGKPAARVAASSCMSCHSVAEWPMKSFLLPMASTPGMEPPFFGRALPNSMDVMTGEGPNYLYRPGTMEFNSWFQSLPGSVPKDDGRTSLDYHMNLTWKALPLWKKHNLQAKLPPARFNKLLLDPAHTSKDGILRQSSAK